MNVDLDEIVMMDISDDALERAAGTPMQIGTITLGCEGCRMNTTAPPCHWQG